MFSRCESLISLDLSGFNTSNVTDMTWMFERCSSLQSLDLSSFDTRKVVYQMGEDIKDVIKKWSK
jgi:surface protein